MGRASEGGGDSTGQAEEGRGGGGGGTRYEEREARLYKPNTHVSEICEWDLIFEFSRCQKELLVVVIEL